MHYHIEIVLPPVKDIKLAVKQIMAQFDENGKDEDGYENRHAFWDFYKIGGRWSGVKLEALLDKEKMEAFNQELIDRGVTVANFQCGKQELSPSSQIPMVDALWNEFFPESPLKVCPLFQHFNDQYNDTAYYPDVMKLKEIPASLTAERVIISGPCYGDEEKLEAKYMLQTSFWNGVNHYETKWDGLVVDAIKEYKDRIKDCKDDYKEKHMPKDDWLVVTVDIHS